MVYRSGGRGEWGGDGSVRMCEGDGRMESVVGKTVAMQRRPTLPNMNQNSPLHLRPTHVVHGQVDALQKKLAEPFDAYAD